MKAALLLLAAASIGSCSSGQPQKAAKVLEVRRAHIEELRRDGVKSEDLLRDSDKFDGVFPAQVAHECGVQRFEIKSATDGYLAVIIRPEFLNESTISCLRAKGGDYVRLSFIDPEFS